MEGGKVTLMQGLGVMQGPVHDCTSRKPRVRLQQANVGYIQAFRVQSHFGSACTGETVVIM